MKSLVRKELRETSAVTALALVVLLVWGVYVIGIRSLREDGSGYHYPMSEAFPVLLGIVGALYAAALGLSQAYREWLRGTWPYLLHRPGQRVTLVVVKLLVGLTVLQAVLALPVLLLGGWLGWPGHVAQPFEWWMTALCWRLWMVAPLVYLGAFLVGVRPAGWFGSRVLPLGAALFLSFWCMAPMPWPWAAALVALGALVQVTAILHVVRTLDAG